MFLTPFTAALRAQDSTGVVTSTLPNGTIPPAPTATRVTSDVENASLNAQIEALMAKMSPAERVGQLFVITFDGNETGFESDIAQLIYAYHIGGIVLSPRMRNFSNAKGEDTPRQVAKLVNQLQAISYGYLLPSATALNPVTAQTWPPTGTASLAAKTGVAPLNLPLLIAVEQSGDDLPTTALRRDFTPLPTQLALGATWDPDLTRKVGQIVGRELRAVGVNMLLGPNLDVVEQPRTDSVGALGVQSFGGDPYWVSLLGHAYITGVHEGSAGRIATIVRHFPGQGNIDRLPDQEVATVQKTLPELRSMAIEPFFNVTRQTSTILRPDGDPGATDGMMSSHTRYSALQGTIPGHIGPISLAPELNMMVNQGEFKDWHAGGGILMSDALGVPAVRRYYDTSLKEFPHRRVALDAFTAGHDLLYLSEPQSGLDWATQKQHMIETISFFQERNASDPDFTTHVDESFRRILRLKLGLYAGGYSPNAILSTTSTQTATLPLVTNEPLIPLEKVLVQEADLNVLNAGNRKDANKIMEQVARESITILYPDASQLPDALPTAPGETDHLLIFSDSRLLRECDKCTIEAALGPDAMAKIIDTWYGSNATGQLHTNQVVSRTFTDLAELLNTTNKNATPVTSTTTVITPTATPIITSTHAIATNEPSGEGAEPSVQDLDKNVKTERLISESNWLIFAMLDVDPAQHVNSDIVKQFLHERSDQLANKHVIVFALNAPYFLDATEISKLTAYFGVYSKTQPFLESAVRALFRSYPPIGAPPVDVPGTRFGALVERLKSDPSRPLELHIMLGDQEVTPSGADESQRKLNVGDTIRLSVGPVLDYNGKSVHDDTLVNFQVKYQSDPAPLTLDPVATHNGFAIRDIMLERAGGLLLAASSDAASTSKPILLNIQGNGLGNVTATPQTAPTATLTPMTPTATITKTPSVSPAVTPQNHGVLPSPDDPRRVNLITLVIALLTIVITLSLLLIVQIWILPRHTLVRSMLWATIFGLSAYILYGVGVIPGSNLLHDSLRNFGPVVVVFIAMLLPLLWLQLRTEQPE
jgi:beta-N-acetylhexosaminidase